MQDLDIKAIGFHAPDTLSRMREQSLLERLNVGAPWAPQADGRFDMLAVA